MASASAADVWADAPAEQVPRDRLVGDPRRVEVPRHQPGIHARAFTEGLRHPQVGVPAPGLLLRLVGRVADERVREPVGHRRVSLRDRLDDAGALELPELRGELAPAQARDGAEEVDVDVAPDHRRRLGERFLVGRARRAAR